METRQIKGHEIAKMLGKYIKKNLDGSYLVPSKTSNDMYRVDEMFNCNCLDCTTRNVTCKHGYALRYYLQVERPAGKVVHRERLTVKQAWRAYDAGQTEEIKLFDELLKDLVQEIDEPSYIFGRPRLSLREQAFCTIQKVYSQLSCRRAVSLFGNAVERGQIAHKPHYGATAKFLNREDATPLLEQLVTISAAPLKSVETAFAVDSSGFTSSQFGSYCNEKYNLERHHEFIKAHACVGTKTNVVTSVSITEGEGADSPQFPVVVQATANGGFQVQEVSADKAYSSRANLERTAELGATPYIPFKTNATGRARGSSVWRKMYHYFQMHQSEFYEYYHKRSNIESTFAAIKKKFGEKLKSKNPTARKNELLCKILAYNLTVVIHEMKELGITPEFCSLSPATVLKGG